MDSILIIQHDNENREVFEFWFDRRTLVLDRYRKERKVKRTWNIEKQYDRIFDRRSDITETDVPLTDKIKQQAIQAFVSQIACMKWGEYKRQ